MNFDVQMCSFAELGLFAEQDSDAKVVRLAPSGPSIRSRPSTTQADVGELTALIALRDRAALAQAGVAGAGRPCDWQTSAR